MNFDLLKAAFDLTEKVNDTSPYYPWPQDAWRNVSSTVCANPRGCSAFGLFSNSTGNDTVISRLFDYNDHCSGLGRIKNCIGGAYAFFESCVQPSYLGETPLFGNDTVVQTATDLADGCLDVTGEIRGINCDAFNCTEIASCLSDRFATCELGDDDHQSTVALIAVLVLFVCIVGCITYCMSNRKEHESREEVHGLVDDGYGSGSDFSPY